MLAAALDRWRMAGYRIAIDDLGPSMVNQTELFELPFHTVKLDKDIVLQSQVDRLAERYLQRTVANAQSRPISIIAEGSRTRRCGSACATWGGPGAGLPGGARPARLGAADLAGCLERVCAATGAFGFLTARPFIGGTEGSGKDQRPVLRRRCEPSAHCLDRAPQDFLPLAALS